ncbi:MAG TPA: sugar ABC transporter ATP-binding protein [Gemmatales bacterium]|nr:sugar ABC transporter ATP-binding protein [Gemmatales bacterium]
MIPLLEVRSISKSYPGVQALQDVSLSVQPGIVCAIVGENGAGKSTLMKIIAGVEQPDRGTLVWAGSPVKFDGVQQAEKKGIVLIHQELNLVHNLDIAANLFLGREKTWGGPLRLLHQKMYPEAESLLQLVGLKLPATTRVGNLSVGQQQLVEIARALSLESKLLIMDEPTSSLTDKETQTLYGVIQSLKSHNVSILFISHRLKEVQHLADHAYVLKDGRLSGELKRGDISPETLIALMIGRDIKHQQHERKEQKEKILQVEALKWLPQQKGISLHVCKGEILGMAGLVGAGRTEFAETLFGIRACLGGKMKLGDKPYTPKNPRHAMASGIFLVPEDRRHHGLVLVDTIRSNISLATLHLRQLFGLIRRGSELAICKNKVNQLNIRTPTIEQAVGLLSGGNQQKVVLSKGLVRQPQLLILDEPTRGVDVGAKAEIYAIMRELASQGVGILMISSDLEEVIGVSDRAVVLHDAQLAGELHRDQMTEENVMHYATGQGWRKAS